MLDLSAHYTEKFTAPDPEGGNADSIIGSQTFDGLPFMVRGRAYLYGQYDAMGKDKEAFRKKRPDLIEIQVGRAFDELHLLHTTRWPDVEGRTIAQAHLNYADGTEEKLDIGYGVHVRDWQRLQTEVREALVDSNSKVVWRGPGQERFQSSERMFKSLLMNPQPKKVVESIDIISTNKLATYSLSAATVVNSDPKRSVTPAVPLDRPEHDFDGKIIVRVLDENDQPIKGAWIDTGFKVPNTTWSTVTSPVLTSAQGFAYVMYPTAWADRVLMGARKDGKTRGRKSFSVQDENSWKPGMIVTFHLKDIDQDPG